MRGREREKGGKEGEESLLMLLEGGKVDEEICWLPIYYVVIIFSHFSPPAGSSVPC